ncbi:MAG: response regulator [Bacteriovoracaceae bacterium]|nr:response regulator [Bacteriovoracaceae bacterium]
MKYKILIVDDSELTRKIMTKTLSMTCLDIGEFIYASNGREALKKLDENWIDIVFADINMPVMNGIEMIEKMHEDGILKTVPVVMVSTDGSQARIEELKMKGIRAYIRKPFKPELVRDVVNDLLGEK